MTNKKLAIIVILTILFGATLIQFSIDFLGITILVLGIWMLVMFPLLKDMLK